MHRRALTMENKNLISTELGLVLKLLDVVNSREEYNFLQAEISRLSFSYDNFIIQRNLLKGGMR